MGGYTKVTIKDVATKVGVSVATVSLVISGSPKVAAKTRRKVLTAIDELQYIPNQNAASLRKQNRDVFAALIPDLNNPFYLSIVRGLKDRCSRQGIVLHISETRHDYDIEKAELHFLRGVQTSGYVFIGTVLDDDLIDSLTHCRVVTIDKVYGQKDRYPQILFNNAACMEQAVTYLVSQGCRDIWYITPPIWTHSQQERLRGYQQAMHQAQLPYSEKVCISYDSQMNMMEAGYIQMKQILANNQPDAVIAASDLYAIGVMRAAREQNLKMPEELSIVGFDNTLYGQYSHPPLTTFSLPLKRMGEMAFELLTQDSSHSAGKMYVTADFIIRDSVRQ
jgi:LacI family transcriptional regulator